MQIDVKDQIGIKGISSMMSVSLAEVVVLLSDRIAKESFEPPACPPLTRGPGTEDTLFSPGAFVWSGLPVSIENGLRWDGLQNPGRPW